MGLDRLSVRPAENGYIVHVATRGQSKRGYGSDYSEKDKIAMNEDHVLKHVKDALGKGGKKGKGLRVKTGRPEGDAVVKVGGKSKAGSKKKMLFKR